jgi:hypothetical protein
MEEGGTGMTRGQLWRIWCYFQQLSKPLDGADTLVFYRDGSIRMFTEEGRTIAHGDYGEDMMASANVALERAKEGGA